MTRETVKLHWLLQSLSKNFVEFYCKILIFWKSFLDFNNVSYWWISWLSRLKTRDQLVTYFCNNFSSQDKCWSISAEVMNSKYLTRSSGKTFLKRAWRASVLQICNFNMTIFLITPQQSIQQRKGPSVYCKVLMVSFCDHNSIISQTLNSNCLDSVTASRPAKTRRLWINCFCLSPLARGKSAKYSNNRITNWVKS